MCYVSLLLTLTLKYIDSALFVQSQKHKMDRLINLQIKICRAAVIRD